VRFKAHVQCGPALALGVREMQSMWPGLAGGTQNENIYHRSYIAPYHRSRIGWRDAWLLPPPPVYYVPNPFEIVGAIVSLPFTILGAITTPPQEPTCVLPSGDLIPCMAYYQAAPQPYYQPAPQPGYYRPAPNWHSAPPNLPPYPPQGEMQ
jgi:hypothetical protein